MSEATVRKLRNELSRTVDHLRKALEKVAGSSVMLGVDQDAARHQARKAEALLREVPYENPNFIVDENASEGPYLYVDVKDRGTVVIKREDEGIVVDVFPFVVVDEPVATTWAHLNDLFPQDDD